MLGVGWTRVGEGGVGEGSGGGMGTHMGLGPVDEDLAHHPE